jgi:hypothetical protein
VARISKKQNIERTRHSVKAHNRGHLPHMFAVLDTDNPPEDEFLILVQDTDVEPSVKFEFRSLVVFEEYAAVLGIVSPKSQTTAVRHSSIQVKRGRLGNKKAETLLILNRLPLGFLEVPGPVLKGTLKAVGRALADLEYTGRAHNLHWWMALEFALKGWVRTASLQSLAVELQCSPPRYNDNIVEEDGLLLWKEYLERMLAKLDEQLESPKNRNPFFDRLVAATITSFLGVREPGVCAALIRNFASRHGCRTVPDVQMLSCDLPSRFVSEMSAEDAAIGEEILARFAEDEGISRSSLEQRFPSHLHVIANLFLSGRLVSSPEGYIFTREQLLGFKDKLSTPGADLAHLSVRLIKDETGLGRKAAENLQSLFAELFRNGLCHDEPQEQRA